MNAEAKLSAPGMGDGRPATQTRLDRGRQGDAPDHEPADASPTIAHKAPGSRRSRIMRAEEAANERRDACPMRRPDQRVDEMIARHRCAAIRCPFAAKDSRHERRCRESSPLRAASVLDLGLFRSQTAFWNMYLGSRAPASVMVRVNLIELWGIVGACPLIRRSGPPAVRARQCPKDAACSTANARQLGPQKQLVGGKTSAQDKQGHFQGARTTAGASHLADLPKSNRAATRLFSPCPPCGAVSDLFDLTCEHSHAPCEGLIDQRRGRV